MFSRGKDIERFVTPTCRPAMLGNVHDFIHLTFSISADFTPQAISKYKKGLSLRDIEAETGLSKTKIRSTLLKAGIPLRPKIEESIEFSWRREGKKNVKPPYGFVTLMGLLQGIQKSIQLCAPSINDGNLSSP